MPEYPQRYRAHAPEGPLRPIWPRKPSRRRHAGKVAVIRHLLRQPQRAGAGSGSGGGVRAQRHAGALTGQEKCCGMPKLETGRPRGRSSRYKEENIPMLAEAGGCGLGHRGAHSVLRADVQAGAAADVPGRRGRVNGARAIFDPFEYLMLRHKAGMLRTDFKADARQDQLPRALPPAGAEHRPEDPRRAAAGAGHDGRGDRALFGPQRHLGVKSEFRDASMKIGGPVFQRVADSGADYYSSDCPMAGHQIESGLASNGRADASAEAAAHRLRNLERHAETRRAAADVALEQYARERPALRARMIEHRRARQL